MTNIVIKKLCKSFHFKVILSDISLNIPDGESLVIIGPSGGGKSVFVKCIIGLLISDIGSSIMIDEVEVANKHIADRREVAKKFSMLFQGNALFDSINIWQNITFGLTNNADLREEELRKIAISKLEMVDLSADIMNFYPAEISGGMQKRVALARALATNPKIIILDEPTAGLDPATAKMISNLIKRLHTELKLTVITVTHDVKCMKLLANTLILIEQSKIGWYGPLSDIKQSNSQFIRDFIES